MTTYTVVAYEVYKSTRSVEATGVEEAVKKAMNLEYSFELSSEFIRHLDEADVSEVNSPPGKKEGFTIK